MNFTLLVLFKIPQNETVQFRALVAMATKGKIFKNHLLRNHLPDCKIISQKCFSCGPLSNSFKTFESLRKYDCGGTSSLYDTINLEKLLRNHLADFKMLSQKCSFGGPVSNSFRPFGP